LGHSDFAIWRDILKHNTPNLTPALRAIARDLDHAADALSCGHLEALAEVFTRSDG